MKERRAKITVEQMDDDAPKEGLWNHLDVDMLREQRDLIDWCMDEAPLDGGRLETAHGLLNLLDWMLDEAEGFPWPKQGKT